MAEHIWPGTRSGWSSTVSAGDHAEQHRHVRVDRHAAVKAMMRMQQYPRRNRVGQQRTQPLGARGQQLGDVLRFERGLGHRRHEVVHVHVAGRAPGDHGVAAGLR